MTARAQAPRALGPLRAVVLACAGAALVARAEMPLDPDAPWRWISFGADSGLPSARVLDVLETADGTTWAATADGVAWYDGHQWIRAVHDAAPHESRAVALEALAGGGVMAVVDQELVLYSTTGHQRVRVTVDGSPVEVVAAADVGGGQVVALLGAIPGGGTALATLRPLQGPAARIMTPAPPSPRRLVVTSDGDVLVSSSRGLHRLLARSWQQLMPVASEGYVLQAALRDGHGFLLSLSSPLASRGLWRWTPDAPPVRVAEAAVGLCRLADGSVLGAFDSGEVRLLRDGAWHAVDARRDLVQGVSTVAARANGDAWVGTDHGLHLWRRSSRRWTGWRRPGHDLHNHVSGILPRADGSVWLSTAGGVVILSPTGESRFVDEVGGRSLAQLTTIAEDGKGRVWVASGAAFPGAWRLDGDAWTYVGPEQGLVAERVHAIRRTADGRLWFVGLPAKPWGEETRPADVLVLKGDDSFEPWGAEHGVQARRTYDVATAADGSVWLATADGVRRFRDGAWRDFGPADGVQHARSSCIVLDADGTAYACTTGRGVCVIDRHDRVTYLDESAGLVDDEVTGLAFDDAGRLWVASEDGLGMFAGGRHASFRSDSGLPVRRTWPVVARGDRILAGTLGAGLAVLDVTSFDVRPPRVTIPPPIVERDRVLLRWAALAWWGDPAPTQIETRHSIDARPWSAWSTAREVLASDLSPGMHFVSVEARGRLSDARVSPEEASFAVAPPLWRQPAVMALAAALAASALALAGVLWARNRHDRKVLERSEQRYRQLVEEASEVVFALDRSGRISWSNLAGAELLGRRRGELTGHDIMEAVAPESRAIARDALVKSRRTGQVVTFEVTVVAKDGTRHIVEVALGPGGTAERSGWQGIGRDITERRRRDEERQQARRLESLGLLAGGIAHDFNNVLAGVVGQADLALAELPPDSPVRERLDLIERSAMHCADLARQMLDYAGRGSFTVGRIDLGTIAREAAALAQVEIRAGMRVRSEIESGLPLVQGDATQVQRVIANLLRNAMDATVGDDEEIVLQVRHAPEGVEGVRGTWSGAPPEGAVVLVSVTDRGAGMDAETSARAFDPFFSTRRQGRGLGLAASLGIVRAHGGAIALDTLPGQGASFTVALPVAGAGDGGGA